MRHPLLRVFPVLLALLTVSGCGQFAAADPILLNSGAVFTVTLDQSVSSKTASPGNHFEASLAEPLIIDGKEIIPAGATASGRVTLAESAGRFAGNARLGLVLDSITVDGGTYNIETAPVVRASNGRGKRTALGAGIGAAAGAAIGALTGGGKGAAIGAGAGAGAGTAGTALTGERDIYLPAETRLTFRLTQPVELRIT
jgi:hypothetical protein